MALTKTERNTIATLLAKMEGDDFRFVVDHYNQAQNGAQRSAASQFKVGDKVTWVSKYGSTVVGTVTKVNRKTIKVQAGEKGQWSVSPSLLSKA